MVGSQGEPRRCSEHGLTAGPDGLCVLCRRARQPVDRGAGGFRLGWLAVFAAVAGAAGYWFHKRRAAAPPPSAGSPVAAKTATAKPTPRPARRQLVAAARADAGRSRELADARASADARPRDAGARPVDAPSRAVALRPDSSARQRMNRLYDRMAMRQAIGRVSITMYMATW